MEKRVLKSNASATSQRQPRKENVKGSFYVDHTCIDCDACRMMAPSLYTRENGKSAVTKQPSTPEERALAIEALITCPTFSIHGNDLAKGEIQSASAGLPKLASTLPPTNMAYQDSSSKLTGDDYSIYFTGYASENTFGARSYLLKSKQGNIMFDVPRYTPNLVKRIEELGGIDYIVLSHRDDIFGHDKWAKHFSAKRVYHHNEAIRSGFTPEVELSGEGPWSLPDRDDVEIVFTPGHSPGSICSYHTPSKTLFTGDHLFYRHLLGKVEITTVYQWKHEVQLESLGAIKAYDVRCILPGHGRQAWFKDAGDWRDMIDDLVAVHS